MVNIRGYITTHFAKSFMTIFLPFFLIISLVYLIKIAGLTAQIKLTFMELLILYSYSVPNIIFYTLPLSFIAALTNILIKLSTDTELIVLYALGLKASKVLNSLIFISLLFSALLLVISFLAMPMSKQLYKSFKEEKKAEAKLNIVPGKLGQKFGDYYIYVKKKKDDNTFIDLVIYNRTDINNEQFFAAKRGQLNKHNGRTSLLLRDGYGYTYASDTLQQAKYQTLEAFDTTKKQAYHFQDTIAYWKTAEHDIKVRHRLFFFLFVSFIPFLSIFYIAAFSMINPRYQSNHSFIIISATALILYIIASSLEKWGTVPLFIGIFPAIMGMGYWLFQRRVARYF